ncbi:hypothetical protein ACH5RR_010808 [Cinchona calisaya]|uniref:Transmembrane protein n=1 Tax=Cinchona calisaya TaxID=153742 RepID=A0ABD3AK58_9GENT
MSSTAATSSTILCTIFIFLAIFSNSNDALTAYQVLEEYDLPVGLLPKGVTSYELDSSTGEFTVYLNETCTFTIEGYKLKYKTQITGVISKDALKDLSGVQVKILFFWLNLQEVTRDGDELIFSVGIASADFPLSNFAQSPQCGCGFDCAVNLIETVTSFNSFN